MKVKFGTMLVLLLCFAASGFSSFAMGSVVASVGEVICFPDGGWYIGFTLIYDGPLTNDTGTGGDYVATFLFEDDRSLGGGIGAWDDSSVYPWTGGAGILHSYADVVHVIVLDVTTWDMPGMFTYDDLIGRDDVLDAMSVRYEDYCDERGNSGEVSDAVQPPDARVNWQYGDLNAVLYRGTDSEGNAALTVYCYDGEDTWLGLHITSADLENAPIEANGCDVTLYTLENGQVQLNILDPEGKLYEIICDDLACESPVMRYLDWNE